MKMNKNYPALSRILSLPLLTLLFGLLSFGVSAQINFSQSTLNLNGLTTISGATSMEFGPDGRLYVSDYSPSGGISGEIKALTVERNGPTSYLVTAVEILEGVSTIANHNDNGTDAPALNGRRQVTGLTVGGTAANPIVYVSSSDVRIGGGTGTGQKDVGLDTNSGVITRMTKSGPNAWEVVDLVRGLPRSEENHATNGMDLTTVNGTDYLIVSSGGFTNAGGPSNNFALITEYALAGAVLSVNLTQLNQLPIQNDNGRSYIYDLPTLDDPTRPNANTINDPDSAGYDGVDVNDPWGGNDGLNQAKLVPGSPVQVFSPGYRNSYDLVVTESGSLYVTDNGANGGWGGFPVGEGTANPTNDYDPMEPGSQGPSGNEQIDNKDHLELVTTDVQNYAPGSFYGGHPNPVRANPLGAGLYTDNSSALGTAGSPLWRFQVYDPDGSTPGSTTDPNAGLPADWPPVPISMANPVEGDWRGPTVPNPDGEDDNPVVIWGTNTNGITEYTASNFGNAMKGNLLATHSGGNVRRVQLNASGTSQQLTQNFLSTGGGFLLGITTNGDGEVFPGTVWVGSLSGPITVFEPQDFVTCIQPGEPGYDALADYDGDGYTNQDEEDNGTDACNGGSSPNDFDKVLGAPLLSDLNDTDDDGDGISDALDPMQLGEPGLTTSQAFALPIFNDLFNDQQGLGGIFGLGMTGLMNNGDTGANWIDWLDDRDQGPNPNDVLGGAPGIMTSHMTSGTALGTLNNQDKGYQYGVQVDATKGPFTVIGGMNGFSGPLRLYGNDEAVGGELGFFIGDGTQSNYIKFVVTVDGFTVLQEINDVPQAPISLPLAIANRPSAGIVFYFLVDPSNGSVGFEYAVDGGARVFVGQVTAQGEVLNALQQSGKDLMVGFTGTSGTPGVELEGSWDFLNVIGNQPVIIDQLEDLTRFVNAVDEAFDLNTYFADDQGTQNLTYTVQTNTNPAVGANISTNTLTLSYPSTAENTSITILATDADDNFTEQTFSVLVTDSPIVLYRVNAGGPEIASIDGEINWSADTVANNSPYLVVPGTNQSFASSIQTLTPQVNTNTTPLDIFNSERFDDAQGTPNMTYSFPVATNGNYEVRIYMGNSFVGTSDPGERIFDVTLENELYPALQQIDLSKTYGHQVGTVITYVVPVDDGNLDIVFKHGAFENPLVNAIEILDVSNTDTPIYPFMIADQLSNAGQSLNGSLTVQAIGGDGNLTYTAAGLPSGLFIDPSNGQIGGTIDVTAAAGSPYTVTVTIDDSDASTTDEAQLSFQWTVVEAFAYRINAGGSAIETTGDIGPRWENNATSGAQNEGVYEVNTGVVTGFTTIDFNQKDRSIPAYINEFSFSGVFGSERYDLAAQPEMMYTLPVENGEYVVNLYFANGFTGTNEVGDRIFDIFIEGNLVEDNLDLISRFGHQVAGMLSYSVNVADGSMNISFGHVIENPVLNGIEVFKIDSSDPVLSLTSIPNQTNDSFDTVSFGANAEGGNPNESISYYISGQPAGVIIDATTGVISGSITAQASTGGSNGDGIHNVTVTVLKPGSAPDSQAFTWNVEGDAQFWTDLNENQSYTARHENSFVQAGNKFYLMGGRENAKTIDVYDYASNSWTSLVDSAPFEFNHYQATEYQGLIWVIGAFKTNTFPIEAPADFIWAFDPSTNEWIQGPEIPSGRKRGSTGLAVYNDKFYIVGGNTIGHDGGFVNWFDEYDPATGTWTTLANAPRARDHFSAAVIGNKLYASGGRLSGGSGGVFKPTVPEVDVYDFTTSTWSTLPVGQNIPTPRAAASAVNFNNKLIVIGGEVQNELVYGVNTDDALKITEEYDPATGTWSRLPDLNFERHGTQAIVSGQGIFTLAGSPNRGGGNQKNMEVFGNNSPEGTALLASELSAPSSVLIASGTSETIALEILGGNVGKFIRSIELGGPDAADFNIASGSLTNALLGANSGHTIEIALNNAAGNKNAVLSITYGIASTLNIALSNTSDSGLVVANPGTQNNNEQDEVALQINAAGGTSLSYSAIGLPPTLSIDPSTGLITGTISDGGVGAGSFQEENGLVVVEAESGNTAGWNSTNINGATGIIANTNSLNNQNGSTIPYQITISEPGVYRFNWRSFYSGPSPTDENDNWLRFPNNDNVWFFGLKGAPTSEAAIISNLQGSQTNIVFPGGTPRQTPATMPEGVSNNGYLKVYRSGGTSQVYDWQAKTSDFDPHDIYVWFVNPGTYTMEISERSLGHAIDKFALYKVDTYGASYNANQLTNTSESPVGGVGAGAADNSPYNVEVTVSTGDSPPTTETITFIWNIGEVGDEAPVAIVSATPLNGIAPLAVSFTGSESQDAIAITSYSWDFDDGTSAVTIANPVHTFMAPGVYNVSLTVGNAAGLTDTALVTITVSGIAINQAPVVTDPGEQNGVEGDVVSLQVTATDPDDDVLAYSATGLPTGLTMDAVTGLISGTIETGASVNSPYTVTVTVTDNGSPVESTTVIFTWNVTDVNVNQAPVVTDPGEQNGVEGDVVSLQVTATDPDDDVLAYSATGLPTGLTMDAVTGLISGTIETGASVNSPYTVTVTVTDNGSPVESTTVIFTWNVTDVNVNLAPVVTDPGEQNGVEGDVVSLQVTATDPDDDVLAYSATGLPTGLTMDAVTGLISGTIETGASVNSPYTVTVTVTDNGSPVESTTVIFTWNVTDVNVNLAPVVTDPGEQNGVEGDVVSLQVTATDPDDDVLAYSATGLPTGLTMDAVTGLISGTIETGASVNSPYTVTVTVTDNGSPVESTSVTFTWIITDMPVNQSPLAIATADVDSGPSPLTVNFTGSNSTDDSGIVSYLWDFGTGDVSTLENPNYTFEIQGTFEVTLTVVDEEGMEDSVVLTIEVDDNIPLENPDGNSIIIAPNPAVNSTEVWVDLIDNSEVLGMYIYDSSGRLVQNYNLMGINSNNGSYSVNTSNLHNGLYSVYVFISGETKPLVSKLLVQR